MGQLKKLIIDKYDTWFNFNPVFYKQGFGIVTFFIAVVISSFFSILNNYVCSEYGFDLLNPVFIFGVVITFTLAFGLYLYHRFALYCFSVKYPNQEFNPGWRVNSGGSVSGGSYKEFFDTNALVIGSVSAVILATIALVQFFSQFFFWFWVLLVVGLVLGILVVALIGSVKGFRFFTTRGVIYGFGLLVLVGAGVVALRGYNDPVIEDVATSIPSIAASEVPGNVVEIDSSISIDKDLNESLPVLTDTQSRGLIEYHLNYVGAFVYKTNLNLFSYRQAFMSATGTEAKRVTWNQFVNGTETTVSAESIYKRLDAWYRIGYVGEEDYVIESFEAQIDGLNLEVAEKELYKKFAQLIVEASRIHMELSKAAMDAGGDTDKLGIARDWQRQLDAVYSELNAVAKEINEYVGKSTFITFTYQTLGNDYFDLLVSAYSERIQDVVVTATPSTDILSGVIQLASIPTLVPTSSPIPTIAPSATPIPTEFPVEPHQSDCLKADEITAYAWEQIGILYSINSYEYTVPVSYAYWDPCPNRPDKFIMVTYRSDEQGWRPTLVNTVPGGTNPRENYRIFVISNHQVDIAPVGVRTMYDVPPTPVIEPHQADCLKADEITAYAWEQMAILHAYENSDYRVPVSIGYWDYCPNRPDKFIMVTYRSDEQGWRPTLVNTVPADTTARTQYRFFIVDSWSVEVYPINGQTYYDKRSGGK